jgi:catechol 2,3-dioxygenase-like lactoylglutathione lyase family enzyme
MHTTRLDHVTLRTTKLAATRDFFVEVAGLRVGARPPFRFPGFWLYDETGPAVHLAGPAVDASLERYLGARLASAEAGTGAVDHIAFRASGRAAFEQRLRALNVHFESRTVPELGEHQLFVQDPNGIAVEFIFAVDEAQQSERAQAGGVANAQS